MSKIPANEEILSYAPHSKERQELMKELDQLSSEILEIPCFIDGEEIFTGNIVEQVMPHNHKHVLAKVHLAGEKEIIRACDSASKAQSKWLSMGLEKRCEIFEHAAELLSTSWRMRANASTMLNQSKTIFQSEIDVVCELVDFWRFNTHYARQFHEQLQPPISPEGVVNSSEVRPLEGFVLAITPFNFTSIAANLPTAPAIVGCTSVWKPSRNSYLSNWVIMQLLIESGLPQGVINFVPSLGSEIGKHAMRHRDFAGLHFTGSSSTFQQLWKDVATALPLLKSYPRIVGETGGKDFIVAHHDCDQKALLVALLRGAFEFQGQKCSAASRAYIPQSVWKEMGSELINEIKNIKIGPPTDFSNFMTAVIDKNAYHKITGYINRAKANPKCSIVCGGGSDDKEGWYIEPTVIISEDPRSEPMVEEIFGPVLTIHLYADERFTEILEECDQASEYALTGSIMSTNEQNIQMALKSLRYTAGNFYINDKPTGAVVGQQPFGGGRASGTNDKAGSPLNLLRWISPRTIKRTLHPPHEWRYPFMDER